MRVGRAAPRPCRSGLRAAPDARRVPRRGEGRPTRSLPGTDGENRREGPAWARRWAWGRPSPRQPRTGTAAEGTERRAGVLCPRAGGGLGRSPFSQWGLRYPGAHRVPICPIPKAAVGDCWPVIGTAPLLRLRDDSQPQSVFSNSSSSSVPSSSLRNVTLL